MLEPFEFSVLRRANILKLAEGGVRVFASPFVRRWLLGLLWKHDPLRIVPLLDDGKIDVPTLIREVVRRMCPGQISAAEKKKKNDTFSQAPPGPKEIIYKQEFHAVLRDLVAEYPGLR